MDSRVAIRLKRLRIKEKNSILISDFQVAAATKCELAKYCMSSLFIII